MVVILDTHLKETVHVTYEFKTDMDEDRVREFAKEIEANAEAYLLDGESFTLRPVPRNRKPVS